MLYTYSQLKQELYENWEYLTEARYPHDLLTEYADSAVPVYTFEIIKEWQELESDYRDNWREFTESVDSITHAMSLDLYNYYLTNYQSAYQEILIERGEEE